MTYISRIDTKSALLDRPIWSALETHIAPFSDRLGSARALAPAYGPLASAASQAEIQDFLALISYRKEPLLTFEVDTPMDRRFCIAEDQVSGVQLIGNAISQSKNLFEIIDLGEKDADQIFDLAQRTRPGPFARRTHMLGNFIGIFEDGKLIAMAGQRLRFPGFTEISAVCVDGPFRGLGMGAELVRQMSQRILDSGDVPFLHAYESNVSAISLYKRLGFEPRARLQVTKWAHNAAVQFD